jgi:glycosyltransferase involved in cell wall biosynthesis
VSAVAAEYLVAAVSLHAAAVRAFVRGSEVLHIHNPPDIFFLAAALFRLGGRRVIFDHHDLSPELVEVRFGRPHLIRAARLSERLTFAMSSHVLAANQSHAEIALTRGALPAERVTVVRNAPTLDWVALPTQVRPGRLKSIRLAYLGAIAVQDGLEDLAQILARVIELRPDLDVDLTVVGDGDGRGAFNAALQRWRVADRVTMTGWLSRDRVPDILREADICVDPAPATPLNERSTMIKLGEYLALGKPIVAYDLLESRRTVEDAAVLVPSGSPDAFAAAIISLADEPDLRAALSLRARERVRDLTWDKSEEALLRVYRGLTRR